VRERMFIMINRGKVVTPPPGHRQIICCGQAYSRKNPSVSAPFWCSSEGAARCDTEKGTKTVYGRKKTLSPNLLWRVKGILKFAGLFRNRPMEEERTESQAAAQVHDAANEVRVAVSMTLLEPASMVLIPVYMLQGVEGVCTEVIERIGHLARETVLKAGDPAEGWQVVGLSVFFLCSAWCAPSSHACARSLYL